MADKQELRDRWKSSRAAGGDGQEPPEQRKEVKEKRRSRSREKRRSRSRSRDRKRSRSRSHKKKRSRSRERKRSRGRRSRSRDRKRSRERRGRSSSGSPSPPRVRKVGAWDEHRNREKERQDRQKVAEKALNGTKTQLREEMMESISQRLAEFKKKSSSPAVEDKPPPLGLVAPGLVPPPLGMAPGLLPPRPPPGALPYQGLRPPLAPHGLAPSAPALDSPPKPTPLDLGKMSSFGIKMALAPPPKALKAAPKAVRAGYRGQQASKPAVFDCDSESEDEEIPTEARYESHRGAPHRAHA